MNNDLISREALKKDFESLQSSMHKINPLLNAISFNVVYSIIDNAPTVENITVFSEGADEETLEDIKKELEKVLDKLKERNNG